MLCGVCSLQNARPQCYYSQFRRASPLLKSSLSTAVPRRVCIARLGTMAASVDDFIESINLQYEKVHKAFEDNFWSTKMGLKGSSAEALAATKNQYDEFLADPAHLQAVQAQLQSKALTDEQRKVLQIFEKTFSCYTTANPEAAALNAKLNELEAKLASERNTMPVGYRKGPGEFVKASSVQLRDMMRTSDDEAQRKACYEGLAVIGDFVAEPLCEIVKTRNALAKAQGYKDYYDYKVSITEGFGKDKLFQILDGLETASRDTLTTARTRLAQEKGDAALLPWNMGHAMAGTTEKALDPFFPFENAVDVWARCFAALGIAYRGATMSLDLLDREGKYSNGFCHWPQPAWRRADGSWVASVTNFTSLATPNAVGSGKTALATLLHEGGHAAHFANIDQRSPLFSQERAPTSVAYAENQSMFLDSIMSDADWMAKYAKDRQGNVVPWDIIQQHIEATHPYQVFMLRAMLAVPYFEKALYELEEDQLTGKNIRSLAAKVEQDIQGGASSRPLLSVPHILSSEASAYYHGYVLAEMSVHQTRSYFQRKYGYITDNPNVGRELEEVYWRPGNSASFLSLVEQLTGSPLDGSYWVDELATPLDAKVKEQHAAYERGLAEGPAILPGGDVDLQMRVKLVDGDVVISDTQTDNGLKGACAKFKQFVEQKYLVAAA